MLEYVKRKTQTSRKQCENPPRVTIRLPQHGKEKAMELTKVACNSCGAPLEVPDNANFVTCRYCKAQLQVKRTQSTVFTEVLNRIDQRTADMADDLDAIRRETAIERLDREWAMRRSSLVGRTKDGSEREPSATAGLIGACVAGGFGIFWTIMAITMMSEASSHGVGPPAIIQVGFPCFGVVFVIVAIAGGIKAMTSSSAYSQEFQQYQQRREALLRDIERAESKT
jgi:hypothetical protein